MSMLLAVYNKQEVLERTNLPTFLTLFKMSFELKPAFAPT
jgi:hypothetical protein